MIIVDNNNNISIRGFFLYSPSAKYENGDFVVYGNTIYVCSPREGSITISNEIPSESDNFYVYLGDQLADISEFLDYSENGGGEKKYISLSSLPALLNNFMAGLTNSGIIGDTISYTGEEGSFIVSIKEVDSETLFDKNTILSDLMMKDNINHGIFKVSRYLPEIKEYVYDDPGLKDLDDYCLLKQYSYLDSQGTLIRVQELIDHSNGFLFYRSAPKLFGENSEYSVETTVNTAFKFATIHTKDLQRKANNLFRVYSARLKGFESRLEDLQENFRFKGISIPDREEEPKELIFQEKNPSGVGYVNSLSEIGPITVTVLTKIYNSLNPTSGRYAFESNSLTIDPLFGDVDYYVKDDLFLSVNVTYTGVAEETEGSYRKVTVQNLSDISIDCGRGFINLPEEMDSVETLSTIELGGITEMYLLLKSTSLSSVENVDPHCKISIICNKLFENNLDLDFIAFDYSIYNDQGNLLGGPYTAIFRKNGLSETWVQEYDVNRSSQYKDESLNYVITYSDLSKNSENIVSFGEKSIYKFKIENKLSTSLYYSGFLSDNDSLNTGLEFELKSSSEVEFFGFKNRDDRGIYFFSKEENPGLLKITIETNNGVVNEYKTISPNLVNYGNYKKPIISFKDLYSKYGDDCTIKLSVGLIEDSGDDNDIPDDEGNNTPPPPTTTTGTVTLRNESNVSVYWYLVERGTFNIINKYSPHSSNSSENSCKVPHFGKITGGDSVELSIGSQSLDYNHITKPCDIKIFRALEEDNSNYEISVITPGHAYTSYNEVMTIKWDDIHNNEVFVISTENKELENSPKKFKIRLKDLFDEHSIGNTKITIRQSLRLSYMSKEGDDIDEIYESVEFFDNGEKEIINHKGIPSFITVEKSPLDDSIERDTNNSFFFYKFVLYDSVGNWQQSPQFPYLDAWGEEKKSTSNGGDDYFYNFIYNEPKHFNQCRGSIKVIDVRNSLVDGGVIELSESPHYWINLEGGSELGNNSISVSIESYGRCFTDNSNEMVTPITLKKGEKKRIKVYREGFNSFWKDAQSRLFLSTPEYQISIINSNNDVVYTGKPKTLLKEKYPDSTYTKYGDVHYVTPDSLSDNCTIILGASNTDVTDLGKTKYIKIVNNDSWLDHNQLSHKFITYDLENKAEETFDLLKDAERLIPLFPGQNIKLSETYWPGHQGGYKYLKAKGIDVLLKDSSGNVKLDTTYFKAGDYSWNYGVDRESFIGYSDLSETSIDENTPDIITITPPSLSSLKFIKPYSGSDGGHIIESSLYITESFNVHSDIFPDPTSIERNSYGPDVYFYKKREDRGLWFSDLKEKITFNYIDENTRKPLEIPVGVKLYPDNSGDFSEIPYPNISKTDKLLDGKTDVTYNFGSYETPVIQWGKLKEIDKNLDESLNLYKIEVVSLSNQLNITNDSGFGLIFINGVGDIDYNKSKILCNDGFSGQISYPIGVGIENPVFKIPISLDFNDEVTNPVAIDVSINPDGPYSNQVPTMTIFYDPITKRKYLWDASLYDNEHVEFLVTTDELGKAPSIMLSKPSRSGYFMSISSSLKNNSEINTILTGFDEVGEKLTEEIKFIDNIIYNNFSLTPKNPSPEFSGILPDMVSFRDSFGLTFKSEVSKIKVYIKNKKTNDIIYKSDVIIGVWDNDGGYYKFGTLENPIISYKTLLDNFEGYYLFIDAVITSSTTTTTPTPRSMSRIKSSLRSKDIRLQKGVHYENENVYNDALESFKSGNTSYGPVIIYDEFSSGVIYRDCYLYGEITEEDGKDKTIFNIRENGSIYYSIGFLDGAQVEIYDTPIPLPITTTTTTAPPPPSLSPENPIGSIIESLKITLNGGLSTNSFIESVYYRRYFKR